MRCPLGERAATRVFYDLRYPDVETVDVLFIGEGPGESEDALGKPFIGKAGTLLRETIEAINPPEGINYGFANLVECRPQDISRGRNRQPLENEIRECSPRLAQLIRILNPGVVVALGRVPEFWVPLSLEKAEWDGELKHAYHPSYILRTGGKNSKGYGEYLEFFRKLFHEN